MDNSRGLHVVVARRGGGCPPGERSTTRGGRDGVVARGRSMPLACRREEVEARRDCSASSRFVCQCVGFPRLSMATRRQAEPCPVCRTDLRTSVVRRGATGTQVLRGPAAWTEYTECFGLLFMPCGVVCVDVGTLDFVTTVRVLFLISFCIKLKKIGCARWWLVHLHTHEQHRAWRSLLSRQQDSTTVRYGVAGTGCGLFGAQSVRAKGEESDP
eukprot:6586669-Prymnesium_polylepis.1